MDEVHFQQHGSRCRMWVPPEIRDPVCRHAPTRKTVSYFGAVRLRDGRLVASKPNSPRSSTCSSRPGTVRTQCFGASVLSAKMFNSLGRCV